MLGLFDAGVHRRQGPHRHVYNDAPDVCKQPVALKFFEKRLVSPTPRLISFSREAEIMRRGSETHAGLDGMNAG